MALPEIPSIDDLTKTAATLLQQAMLEADAKNTSQSNADVAVARANQQAIAFVQGVGIHGAYQYLRNHISKQAIPTTSSDEWLDEWLNAYDIPRKGGNFSTGKVLGTGIASEILIAGTLMTHTNGFEYVVLEDSVTDENGNLSVTVQCTIEGIAGNLSEGETLSLVSTEAAIDPEFVVTESGITDGTDEETDAEAIYRLRQRLANPPRGSSPTDYERWALKVAGITRAWGVRAPFGATTAGVIIMADRNEDGLPTETQKQAVHDYIRDPERGPPDELFVIIPTPKYIDVELSIDPDTQTVRDAIELELKDLFYREAVPGGRIPVEHIEEAISIASGEYNHTLYSPEPVAGAFLFSTQFEMLILRHITFRNNDG